MRSRDMVLAAAAALLGVGLVMVHSAGLSPESGSTQPWWEHFRTRHTTYAAAALIVMVLASRINLASLAVKPRLAGLLAGAVMLVGLGLTAAALIPGIGVEVNGARRWLELGGVRFQPSELLKWSMVLGVAVWCAWRGPEMRSALKGLGPVVVITGLGAGLVVMEDLGTAVLIAAVIGAVLLAGGARWWHLALLVLPACGAIVAAVIAAPYRVKRLTTFLDPWAEADGAGYHPIQSMLAFAEGGRLGSGLGNSVQKYYLPEDTTDFVFPVLVEELGFAGAALVVVLILTILWAGMGILRRCDCSFGRLLTLGVLLMFGMQAAFNIAVVTVVVPTKGIALPLISAGGTGWIATGLMLGLVAGLPERDEPLMRNEEERDGVISASPLAA